MNIITSRPSGAGRLVKWLVITAIIALLIFLFARKITQLPLPGLGVEAKTAVVDPKCPTPEQKEVIERNLKLYGAGFSQVTLDVTNIPTISTRVTCWRWRRPWVILIQTRARSTL